VSRVTDKADALAAAWHRRYGPNAPLTKHATVAILSVAKLETGMGDYRSSHNWGQIQRRTITDDERAQINAGVEPAPRDANEFLNGDTSPDTGSYLVWLWKFPNDVEGANKLLEVLLDKRPAIKRAIDSITFEELARLMYETHYYEGSHKRTELGGPQANINAYAGGLRKAADGIAPGLGQWSPPAAAPIVIPPPPEPPPLPPNLEPDPLSVPPAPPAPSAPSAGEVLASPGRGSSSPAGPIAVVAVLVLGLATAIASKFCGGH